ncbi:MAG: LPXTG cell wall anchor domain-containing protein [Oscillospiraceae bacterium]|nr:LPXTG cell wall anchor domain-containing protein [Oscillospiraceae bacterium]
MKISKNMKNNFIAALTATACLPVLCVSAYAAAPEDAAAALERELAGTAGYTADTNIVMQIYNADLREYVDTGKFTFTESKIGGKNQYIAEALDKNGWTVGNYLFTYDGTKADNIEFTSTDNGQCLIDILINRGKLEAILSQAGFDCTNAEYKVVYVKELGYTFYADNGTDGVFYTVDLKNGPFKNDEIFFVDDEFKETAVRLLNGESPRKGPPPTGGSDEGGNPNTGSSATGSDIFAAALAGLAGGAAVFAVKRKEH